MSVGRVAYLVKRFPRVSETFVLNEFLEMRRLGLDATLFALMDPGETIIHPAARELQAEVRYVNIAGRPWYARWRLLRGAVAQFAARPRGLLRVLWALLSVHRSEPSLRYAIEGAWLGSQKALTAALRRLGESTALRSRLGRGAIARAAALDWSNVAARVEKTLAGAVAKRTPA